MNIKKVYIAKSPIAGKGLFAAKDIKAGETIFVPQNGWVEHVQGNYTRSEAKKSQHALAVGPHKWLHTSRKDLLWYLNHSCEPNACVRKVKSIVALRDIKKDEEITIDYALTEEDPFWEMSCSCGTSSCRKHIYSLPFMPELFRKASRNHVATWLKKYTQ